MVSAAAFHAGVFLMIGANFALNFPLLLVAGKALIVEQSRSQVARTTGTPSNTRPARLQIVRGLWSSASLLGWLYVHVDADLDFMAGVVTGRRNHDGLLPFSTYELYIMPTSKSPHGNSLCFTLALAAAIVLAHTLRGVHTATR